MFGALKRGRFRSLASLILVVNVVCELQQKRTLAASRGFLAAARLSCLSNEQVVGNVAPVLRVGRCQRSFVLRTLCNITHR